MAKPVNVDNALVARAILREVRTTPQKARRVVNLIRGERADSALATLKFANQAIGADLYVLLNSAVANAKQKNPSLRDASELWVAEATVGEGFTLKRFRPRAQGRGFSINKRTSTITLVVSDDVNYRSNGPRKVAAHKKANAGRVAKPIAGKPVAAKSAPAKSAPADTEGKAE
ncbi:MAG: 50S ribosomal protein L22 [Actinomycetes bacterium]